VVCHGKELSYYTPCEQDETVSCNHECPLSTLLLHLHLNCIGTKICFVSSSSNKLPHFISATNFKIMLRWDEFMKSLHARPSVRFVCSFV